MHFSYFKVCLISVPKSDAMEEIEVFSRQIQITTPPSSSSFLQRFSREAWDGLSIYQRQACLKKGAVHVIGKPRCSPLGIEDMNDPRLAHLINFNAARECQGKPSIVCFPPLTEFWSEHRSNVS